MVFWVWFFEYQWFFWVSMGEKYWSNVLLICNILWARLGPIFVKKVLNSLAIGFLSDIIPFSVSSVVGRDWLIFWAFPVFSFETCYCDMSLCFSNRFE